MKPALRTLPEKKLLGMRLRMSLAVNRTGQLWQSFMPRRREITQAVGTDLYSVEVYVPEYFTAFDPAREFDKWACVEVTDVQEIPAGMESLTIPEGLYAVFPYKGPGSAAGPFFHALFSTWLPEAGLQVDDRPHFALMGEKYKNESPDSEEEIWVPVK